MRKRGGGAHYEVLLDGEFSASHYLRGYQHGKDEPMHGHNWRVQIEVRTPSLDVRGISVDFVSVRERLKQELHQLDYKLINDLPFFKRVNPSSENMAKFIYDRLEDHIAKEGGTLSRVTVWETQYCAASYVKD